MQDGTIKNKPAFWSVFTRILRVS